MKIEADFALLYKKVEEMGAEIRHFDLTPEKIKISEIDKELKLGKPVKLSDIECIEGGLISFKGRQVLLYIQDHGININAVLENSANGRKYHVAYCPTLEEAYKSGRFERYVAKNSTDGNFFITGFNPGTREHKDGMAKLKVCKNCLKHLDYQGYRTSTGQATIFNNFSLSEFFETYQIHFKYKPSGRAGERKDGTYVSDWSERSRQYRASVFWRCESCGVDLSDHRNLLHSHHRNGVKSDNSNANLQALCIECHARQPMHDMEVTNNDKAILSKLRLQQCIYSNKN
ncbi:MAG: hypothetical protein R3E95_20135 [Thiolinea sp.]